MTKEKRRELLRQHGLATMASGIWKENPTMRGYALGVREALKWIMCVDAPTPFRNPAKFETVLFNDCEVFVGPANEPATEPTEVQGGKVYVAWDRKKGEAE